MDKQGGRVAQMKTKLYNSYLVKVSTEEGGVQIAQNSVHVGFLQAPWRIMWMAPNMWDAMVIGWTNKKMIINLTLT